MEPILTEQEKLSKRKKWLKKNGWTFERLAQRLGMARTSAFLAIEKPHGRPELVAMLREIGIPEEFLPEAKYTRPGPKPKWV